LHCKCPLSAVKRTSLFAAQMSANDQSGDDGFVTALRVYWTSVQSASRRFWHIATENP
jgi:hypothetical protein